MTTNLGNLVASVAADLASIMLGQTPLATATQVTALGFSEYMDRRASEAKEILLEELERGNKLASDVDPQSFYGLLFQYLNAVRIGAARRNLQLMARVLLEGSIAPIPFEPDEIASCARVLADLSSEEIVFLGTLSRIQKQNEGQPDSDAVRIVIQDAVMKELVPKVLADPGDFFAVASAVQRTGCVRISSVWGGSRVDATSRLEKLARLSQIESLT